MISSTALTGGYDLDGYGQVAGRMKIVHFLVLAIHLYRVIPTFTMRNSFVPTNTIPFRYGSPFWNVKVLVVKPAQNLCFLLSVSETFYFLSQRHQVEF